MRANSCTEACGVGNASRSVGRHGAKRKRGALCGSVLDMKMFPSQPASRSTSALV